MFWKRARAGLVGGLVALAPLGLVATMSYGGVIAGVDATTAALVAIGLCPILGGLVAGGIAGQGPRRRREWKAAVGAAAGGVAGAILALTLQAVYVARYTLAPLALRQGNLIAVHPLRVSFAVILLAGLLVIVAMLTTQLTARRLPPSRASRRLTAQHPATRDPAARDPSHSTR